MTTALPLGISPVKRLPSNSFFAIPIDLAVSLVGSPVRMTICLALLSAADDVSSGVLILPIKPLYREFNQLSGVLVSSVLSRISFTHSEGIGLDIIIERWA